MTLALVTGGNRGIGFAICAGLARKGIKVLLGSRNEKSGQEASEKLQSEGLDVECIGIDVSDKESIDRGAEEIAKSHGSIDILVNNAGVLHEGSLFEISQEHLLEEMQINLMGPIHMIRVFAKEMVKKGFGRIVNVSSVWGSFEKGLEGPAVYGITKAALNAVTLTSAQVLPANVKINSVCPGWVRTRMGGSSATRTTEEGADTIIWLATLPDDGPTGKFFRDRREISW